jgi:ABC-type transport system substrate-binding protein
VFPFQVVVDESVEGRAASARNSFERFESVQALDPLTLHVRIMEHGFTDLTMILELTALPRWLYGQDAEGQAYTKGSHGVWMNEHWYQGAIGTGPSAWPMGWNLARVPFDDKAVRQAMTLAMDRERMLGEMFLGLGEVTTGPFMKQSTCYDSGIQPWSLAL